MQKVSGHENQKQWKVLPLKSEVCQNIAMLTWLTARNFYLPTPAWWWCVWWWLFLCIWENVQPLISRLCFCFVFVLMEISSAFSLFWQGWNQFGFTRVFLSAPRYDWCAPLSHPSSCMLVNHGPSQQSSKEEYKPWKWGATARYYKPHTKTMLLTGKSMPRSSRQLDHTKTCDDRKETQSAVVWSCFPFIRSGQNHLARHSGRGKKTRQTEEEVGGRHQGMDRPGVRQVPEGSGEQGKMEKTGSKIICGAPTTLTVKGLMMMMRLVRVH